MVCNYFIYGFRVKLCEEKILVMGPFFDDHKYVFSTGHGFKRKRVI